MSDYSCTITHSREEWEWENYSIDFDASATYIHEDMVMYYRDGSGHPGCDDIEDVEYNITRVADEDGNELELNKEGYPVNWTEEQVKALDNAINDYLNNTDWDYPEPDYPDYEED